ncbi:hypothetical protein [Bradyrhizobium genosp. P]|uniref:hypothetical protein n=1 Tax=Bradyrhizobium genosp. P TaxID=83641 RepID=UPI003CE9833D
MASDREKRLLRPRGRYAASLATGLLLSLLASDAVAQMMTPFRYQDQAQRHCPADEVVWLDFAKRKYYLNSQKLYGHGFHGSYVCLREARRNLYRRSLLGLR